MNLLICVRAHQRVVDVYPHISVCSRRRPRLLHRRRRSLRHRAGDCSGGSLEAALLLSLLPRLLHRRHPRLLRHLRRPRPRLLCRRHPRRHRRRHRPRPRLLPPLHRLPPPKRHLLPPPLRRPPHPPLHPRQQLLPPHQHRQRRRLLVPRLRLRPRHPRHPRLLRQRPWARSPWTQGRWPSPSLRRLSSGVVWWTRQCQVAGLRARTLTGIPSSTLARSSV